MTGATERVAAFVHATALQDLPEGVIPKAKKAIADTLAVMLAGATSEDAEPLLRYVEAIDAAGEEPLLGTGLAAVARRRFRRR